MTTVDVVLGPSEIRLLTTRGLSHTTCVVFDVLRATSVFVTALAHGAGRIQPVAEIADALAARKADPTVLLAGERHGLRLTSQDTGGIEFDLGNSPREFTPAVVAGRRIVSTTTNGTRALRACAGAGSTFASSFLNLTATAQRLVAHRPLSIVCVCAGTGEQPAFEDVLAAGALSVALPAEGLPVRLTDSARIATRAFLAAEPSLLEALADSANGRRLLENPALREDVSFCAQRDKFPVLACLDSAGFLTRG